MRILIEIPKEFEMDYYADKFNDFFGRVISDLIDQQKIHKEDTFASGLYEFETLDMLRKSFANSAEIEKWR